jgi:alpha-N-acetylglucosamine transferase
MVSDNTSYSFDFFCLSDTVVKDLPTLQLTESIEHEGVWNKLRLFTNKELQSYTTKIYFDLDVVIHGNIDSLFTLNTKFLNVLRARWKPDSVLQYRQELNTLYNSSIMVWSDASYVHEKYLHLPDLYMLKYKGIDRFFWHEKIKVNEIPPNIAYSYREGATLKDNTPFLFRPEYSVCIFNQQPKVEALPSDSCLQRIWNGSY